MQYKPALKLPKLPTLSFPASRDDGENTTGTSLLGGNDSKGANGSRTSLPKMPFFQSASPKSEPSQSGGAGAFSRMSNFVGSPGSSPTTSTGANGGFVRMPNTGMTEKMKSVAVSAAEDHGMDPNAAEAAMVMNSPPPCPCCKGLSKTDRIKGFLACFALGCACNVLSLGAWRGLVAGKPYRFGFLYTLGNVCCFGATFFLIGPRRQFKSMTKKTRRVSVAVYLGVIFTTFMAMFLPFGNYGFLRTGLVTVLVFTQIAAGWWYTLSYIPYGRAAAVKILKKVKNRVEKMVG